MPTLPWGLSGALPEGTQMAWGARLIFPDDLLWDRQGCLEATTYEQQHMKPALLDWLSNGAGDAARKTARRLAEEREWNSRDTYSFVLYEDKDGLVIGNPQGSGGYLYIAAYLFKHVKED